MESQDKRAETSAHEEKRELSLKLEKKLHEDSYSFIHIKVGHKEGATAAEVFGDQRAVERPLHEEKEVSVVTSASIGHVHKVFEASGIQGWVGPSLTVYGLPEREAQERFGKAHAAGFMNFKIEW